MEFEYLQEADGQPCAELSASRSSQELSTSEPINELMGSEAFCWDTYGTEPIISPAPSSPTSSNALSLDTTQQSDSTPGTMSFGQSNESLPVSPESPRAEGTGLGPMSGSPDDNTNEILFKNMERHPSIPTSLSSFETSPTKVTGNYVYGPQGEGVGDVYQNDPNPSAPYPMYAAQLNFHRPQAPWPINNGIQLDPSWGTGHAACYGQPSQQPWNGYPQMQGSPPSGSYSITQSDQFHQSTSLDSYRHHEDASQLSQVGHGVIVDTPYPPVPCNTCGKQFTGKYVNSPRKANYSF